MKIGLAIKMGEILKVLGRTKSALNYLAEAYDFSLELSK
jgi:hypothetical protein